VLLTPSATAASVFGCRQFPPTGVGGGGDDDNGGDPWRLETRRRFSDRFTPTVRNIFVHQRTAPFLKRPLHVRMTAIVNRRASRTPRVREQPRAN